MATETVTNFTTLTFNPTVSGGQVILSVDTASGAHTLAAGDIVVDAVKVSDVSTDSVEICFMDNSTNSFAVTTVEGEQWLRDTSSSPTYSYSRREVPHTTDGINTISVIVSVSGATSASQTIIIKRRPVP